MNVYAEVPAVVVSISAASDVEAIRCAADWIKAHPGTLLAVLSLATEPADDAIVEIQLVVALDGGPA